MVDGPSRPFRLAARSVFLTYPRCSASGQELLDFLCGLEPTWVYATVGTEAHQDGTPHLHALVLFSKKRDIRNAKHFDWRGYHPNVQPTRSVPEAIAYVQKENCYVECGIRPLSKTSNWSGVISCSDPASALSFVRENFPRDYVLNLERIEYFVNKHFAVIKPLL